MSRKAIHVTVEMPFLDRLRLLLSGGKMHLLFQPTVTGVKLIDVRVASRKAKRLPPPEGANAQPR